MLLTFFVIAVLLVILVPLPIAHPPSQHRYFVIEARQFAYSPAVLQVNPGDTVTIKLVSSDVVHGLYVDGYNVSVKADPGQSKSLTFIADKSGSFRLRCNVACGAMHPFMIGKLEVGFHEWLFRSIGLAILMSGGVYFNLRKNKKQAL
ncbi:MAG: hypothetical protein KatS3mg046_084 [Bellilinea sp.]|nr:MAG: hypothetical protein KatS3mg046_084 [Bellilinea sp.]